MRVLVTGASGFIGAATVRGLASDPQRFEVVAASRRSAGAIHGVAFAPTRSLEDAEGWARALKGVDVLVHAAARAHVGGDDAASAEAFRQVNVAGALALARWASEAGVRRFVFLSSVGVFGAARARAYDEADAPAPVEPYAQSKWAAEQALRDHAAATGIELVVIRPPLVYGPGAPGNFRRLADTVRRGLPLPLGAIRNRRSFVGLGNLVDFIRLCCVHPAAAGQVFCVSDGQDVSTPQFIHALARAMDRRARLLPVPVALLRMAASLAGRRDAVDKLAGDFRVDAGKARALLGWQPPHSLEQGLRAAVGREVS